MACVFPSQHKHAKEHVTNIAVTSVWFSSKFIQIPGEKKAAQDVAVFFGWEVLFETRNLHQALPATPPPFAAPQGLALRRAHCRVDVLGAHSRPPAPGRSTNGG